LTRPYPADTTFGRLFQGDAFYARDLAAPRNHCLADAWGREAILKLAAIFSLFNLPDCAAELLVRFRSRLAKDFVEIGLDLLTAQATGTSTGETYIDYIRSFQEGDDRFKAGARQKLTETRSGRLTAVNPSRFFGPPNPLNGAKCRTTNGWLDVVTPSTPWAYALELRARDDKSVIPDQISLRLSVETLQGKVGVAVETSDRRELLQEITVEPNGVARLEFRTSAVFGAIVLRNASPEGKASRARLRIDEVDILCS
jgi:hypothetical protein